MITDNWLFRFYTCGLSVEQTAKLCCRSVRTVKEWDAGKPIPTELKKLMALDSGRDLSYSHVDWKGWRIQRGMLILPCGRTVRPDQIEHALDVVRLG
ncbi:hypothetical protein VST7929_03028 [Vibrio stylophorae]|uniref:Transcriptional regulator n=1 Tax=Vibrio stylophorae TaxID=659351 RepID=A0ABN8DYM8_9VIBR|nr:DUF3653 domain-containing protein [Vibrio stylophorae]CAH0535454.1 hypothetical protein VST7929_03028 [Vibrio stylophorae]